MIYDIIKELPEKRAIIKGEFKDLHPTNRVTIRDDKGNLYDAIVETRGTGGVCSVTVVDVI